jgi:hypothetical protein
LFDCRFDKNLKDGSKSYKWDRLKSHLKQCEELKKKLFNVKKAEDILERDATLDELVGLHVSRNDLHKVVEHSIIDGIPHFKCTIPGCTKVDPIPVNYYPDARKFNLYSYRKHLDECHSEESDDEEGRGGGSERRSWEGLANEATGIGRYSV